MDQELLLVVMPEYGLIRAKWQESNHVYFFPFVLYAS